MKRVACIHTVFSVIESFTGQLRAGLGADVKIHTLYDDFLATDPGETRDLSAARPEVVAELQAILADSHVPNPDFPVLKNEQL